MATLERHESEWAAAPLRPRASWVRMRDEDGKYRLTMLWTVPEVVAPVAVEERATA